MYSIEVGQLVFSKAGRDAGSHFLVFDILNESFIRVVDGEVHKIENPKKKNLKHLRCLPKVADEVASKLKEGLPLHNAEVRKALKNLGIYQE